MPEKIGVQLERDPLPGIHRLPTARPGDGLGAREDLPADLRRLRVPTREPQDHRQLLPGMAGLRGLRPAGRRKDRKGVPETPDRVILPEINQVADA